MSPLDLQRLATRIERLQRTSTHGWHPADSLSLRNLLPGGRGQQILPDPKRLREIAKQRERSQEDEQWLQQNWRLWLGWTQRAEGYVRDNDPRNPKRIMRDMARGRFPRR